MLVLSRRVGESVVLRDRDTNEVVATVKVAMVDGSKVRLGFDAPMSIRIDREEIDLEINGATR